MMGFFRSLSGMVRLELTSADKEAALSEISAAGMEILSVENCSELSVRFTVTRTSLRHIREMALRKGERLIILEHQGLFTPLWNLHRRPLLITGLLLLLILSVVMSGRVLFVEVEGNEHIPQHLILEAAQDAGIRFGASRRAVRSEKVKNELLGTVPELQWAGVNTYGCRAVISVRERAIAERSPTPMTVSRIAASCDGVITSCTVTRGTALCSVGQAVQKGQVLISGYLDNGLSVTATRAQGEIFAQTQHELTAVTPSETMVRGIQTGQWRNFSLILGKKHINFRNGSGIYEGTCVKMYTEYCLTLPGGYRLPVVLVKETITEYDTSLRTADEAEALHLLTDFSKAYLHRQLVAVSILNAWEDFSCDGGVYRLKGRYACTEMIGREMSEQIGDFHGKTD